MSGDAARKSAHATLRLIAALALATFAANAQAPRWIGIDTHIDTIQRVFYTHADLGQHLADGQIDLVRLREGSMNAPFFALWVPTYYKGAEAVRKTLDLRDAMQSVLDRYPDRIEMATTATDLERIVKSGKIAAVLTLEGGHQIADDLAVLRMYQRMGIRAMTLTHFRNNNWADSSTDKPEHNGLTDFGKQVVREMNRIGMMVDISHVSDKTFYDALAVSTKPVIASHSSCRALADIPRNMTDDMLRALAKNGGVIGINFGAGFLNQQDAKSLMESITGMASLEPNLTGKALDDYAAKDFEKENWSTPRAANATLDDVVAHIDHVVKIAGIDHVGIGTDFDGIPDVPKGLEDASKMPALVAALRKHGYSDADVQKIMGGNFLRVMRQVIGK
ncbi:MAG TPA: dipeptidase [Bryobacteraceae bacterium]|nr:dipeptidase [Bryobacteraceae bacterium]